MDRVLLLKREAFLAAVQAGLDRDQVHPLRADFLEVAVANAYPLVFDNRGASLRY